jgi:ribosomal protein S27AE
MALYFDCAWEWPPWPAFNPDASCPKCGCDVITTTYYAEERYSRFPHIFKGVQLLRIPMPERLRRECVRCGHWWCESVKGAVNDQAPIGSAFYAPPRFVGEAHDG